MHCYTVVHFTGNTFTCLWTHCVFICGTCMTCHTYDMCTCGTCICCRTCMTGAPAAVYTCCIISSSLLWQKKVPDKCQERLLMIAHEVTCPTKIIVRTLPCHQSKPSVRSAAPTTIPCSTKMKATVEKACLKPSAGLHVVEYM